MATPAQATGSSETRLKMEDLPDSQEGLQNKLKSLSAQLEDLEEQKKVVVSALSKKDESTVEEPTEEDIVIVFVEEIEKANQYFEFKLFLKEHAVVKPKRDALENLKMLVKERKVQEDPQFNKLDFERIMEAVQFYILDRKKRNIPDESIQGNTSCEVSSEEGNNWYSLMSLKEIGLAKLIDPFLSLVYHIREKGHVMDKDPLVELGYIKKFDQLCYNSCLVWKLLRKFSEREVMALCIPSHYEEEDVRQAFSVCGNVVSVHLEREGQTANVVFEKSVDAKLAPIIMERMYHFYVTPAFEDYEYQPKDKTLYEEAVIKYHKFRNYSNKSQVETVQT